MHFLDNQFYQCRLPLSARLDFSVSNRSISYDDFNRLEITKHLSAEQRANINVQITSITDQDVSHYVSLLQQSDGMQNIIKDLDRYHQYPLIALLARLQDRISDEQLTTACLLYEAIDQLVQKPAVGHLDYHMKSSKHIKVAFTPVPFSYNPDFKPKLLNAYHLYQSNEAQIKNNNHFFNDDPVTILRVFLKLNDAQFVSFKKQLENVSEAEKVFYSFALPCQELSSWSPFYQIFDSRVNEFNCIRFSGTEVDPAFGLRYFLLPSFSMIKAWFDIRFGEHAITQLPVIGDLKGKRGQELIEEYRDRDIRLINVGLPGAEVSLHADGYYAGKIIFSIHDIYHAIRYSKIKKNERLALIRINAILKDRIQKQNEIDLKPLKWTLIDGELHDSTVKRQQFGELFTNTTGFDQKKEKFQNQWSQHAKKIILEDMVRERKLWQEKFKLSRRDLLPSEQDQYDEIQQSIDPNMARYCLRKVSRHSITAFNKIMDSALGKMANDHPIVAGICLSLSGLYTVIKIDRFIRTKICNK